MARRKPRKKRKQAPRFFLFLTVALAAAAASFWVFRFAQNRIEPLLASDWQGRYTTKVYSAPLRLQRGSLLSIEELETRLKRLGYIRTRHAPESPGEYRAKGGRFEIRPRHFEHPFIRFEPTPAVLEINDDRVVELKPSDSASELLEIILEPELLYEISGPRRVRREPLALADIPPSLLEALVAIEDRRFYQHPGVDLRGIARAAWKNIRVRRIAEGGSTITQQLARNLFLSPRRTLSRKLSEAAIALYIDARFSKQEILRMYLENVYFGQDGPVSIVGLTSASKYFFGKEPARLELAESALLAGLLRSPNGTSPIRHPERALGRRGKVLHAMRREGFITEEERRSAQARPLRLDSGRRQKPRASDYFLAYLQRLLIDRYSDEAMLTRGLTLYTTLDPWLQDNAERTLKSARHQAALVALDPRSGAILALVGGRDFAKSPFDRATVALRQPGSAFKPFVYGAALQNRRRSERVWTLSSLLSDTTRTFRIAGGTWTPRNYDRRYRGPVPFRTAFALSLNAATVNLAAKAGPDRIIEYAENLGILSPLRPELGLALGIFEVTLLELTGAYCPFGNGGFRVTPYGIEIALDAQGGVLEFHAPDPVSVLTSGEAFLMTSLLRQVVTEGTARGLKRWNLENVSAGKTGTTNGGKDAWFIGYTPTLAAGVWTGSDRPAALGITGAGSALPLWAEFIRSSRRFPLRKKNEPPLWPKPEEVVAIIIDPATGLRARAGCTQRRREIFLSGTEPKKYCTLHSGGVLGWFKSLFSRKNKLFSP